MSKLLSATTIAKIQSIVGGNSNPVTKLQALVPGLFSDRYIGGGNPRRFHDATVCFGRLYVQTLGREGRIWWEIVKHEGKWTPVANSIPWTALNPNVFREGVVAA